MTHRPREHARPVSQGRPRVKTDSGSGRHERVVSKTLVRQGIGNDEEITLEYRLRAEGDLPGGCTQAHSDLGLEPLSLLVDQADDRDRNLANVRGQGGELVEALLGGGIEDLQRGKASSRSASLSGTRIVIVQSFLATSCLTSVLRACCCNPADRAGFSSPLGARRHRSRLSPDPAARPRRRAPRDKSIATRANRMPIGLTNRPTLGTRLRRRFERSSRTAGYWRSPRKRIECQLRCRNVQSVAGSTGPPACTVVRHLWLWGNAAERLSVVARADRRSGRSLRRCTRSERTMAHVLLIDDDPALIPEQVRQAFPAPDHRVEVAGTGAEGLERVRAEPPDVILLDLRLPDQSGLEVYQADPPRSTRASRSSSSPWPRRRTRPSRR